MTDLKQEIKDLVRTFDGLKTSLNIKQKEDKLRELKAKSTDVDLWKRPGKARGIMQEISDLRQELEEVESLQEEIKIARELFSRDENAQIENDVKTIAERLKKLKRASLLSNLHDRKNAIVSIHAGQGGVEAMDWTKMLYRMYLKFSESRGWKTQVLDISSGEEAGLKSVTLKVAGPYAYGHLKKEAGTHRLVRQSPFNADRLRQTSFALVEVLPEFNKVDLPGIKISDEELEWNFFRASTQGGQNVQKVSTAVRLKHKPTGIVVTSQAERHQEQNRKLALNLLKSKLWLRKKAQDEEKKKEIKGEYRPASWGTQIRSYVLHPYKMVKDLRTQVETSDTDAVLDGKLDQFIEAELKLA